MEIYISGAITGYEGAKEEFDKVEQMLREEGWEVVNPFKVCSMLPTTFSHEDYMQVCYRLIDICEWVYMMPNWLNSPGAISEYHYATALHKNIRMG